MASPSPLFVFSQEIDHLNDRLARNMTYDVSTCKIAYQNRKVYENGCDDFLPLCR